MCRVVKPLGYSPMDGHFLINNVHIGEQECMFSEQQGARQKGDHCAHHGRTIGILPCVTLSLSDCSSPSIRKSGVIQVRTSYKPQHFWHPEVPERLSPMLFSQTEPGDTARCTERCCTVDQRGCWVRGVSRSGE